MKHALILIAAAVSLAACVENTDRYPRLLPTDQVLAEPTLPDHAPEAAASPDAVDAEAESRAEALRRRAEALRGPVIEPGVLERMGKQ